MPRVRLSGEGRGVVEDRKAVLQQVQRYLEDLILFEGESFLIPHELQATVAEAGAAEAAGAAFADAVVSAARELEGFERQICACTNCALGHSRRRFVFGSGSPNAGIMFIGEAPGAEEDRQGQPFVGAAGQLLTKIIQAIGLSREEVYICNMLKCRPPSNRDPLPEEVAECEPYLKRQIEIVRPKVICTLGRVASQAILRSASSMRQLRGTLHQYEGIPVIVTYHPAALLRNATLKKDTWEDVKWLRREYDGTEVS